MAKVSEVEHTFDCPSCKIKLKATIQKASDFGFFRRSRNTEILFTCPLENIKCSLPIQLNTETIPFKYGKIVNIEILRRDKGS